MRVCFETFGCRLNRAEALDREAELLARGWERTEKHSEADLIVVRGCSVTRRAQRDCEKLIDHLKRHYPATKILIEGCLKDRTSETTRERFLSGGTEPPAIPPVPTRTARAYLKVQDGCSGKCSFCIVPQFRGKSVSTPFADCLDKAKRFIDAGYHEIVVTGCNLALYASDGQRLPELLDALANLGDCRIRLGSIEPGACARDVVSVMAENKRICKFLHLPVQSGSPRILASMCRPYQLKEVDELIDFAVGRMPHLGLGCDMMAGFPGETEVDVIAARGFLKRYPFSNVHVFPYSERPGTPAAGFPMAVPRDLRHARAKKITDVAKELRRKAAKGFLGQDVEMLIEDENKMTGWTGEYFACEVTNPNRISQKRKEIVRVHVMDAHHGRLKGVAV